MPNAPATGSTSCNNRAVDGPVEVQRTATRESLGTISFRSSNRLPLISGARVDSPVIFPPGRARLVTDPWATGSTSPAMTMGIVLVASLAARVAPPPPPVTITSTFNRTNSAARAERRSSSPSACRYSMTMFFPSTYPSSRRPSWNASVRGASAEGKPPLRYPIRGIFVGCCASAGEQKAKSKALSTTPAIFFVMLSYCCLLPTACPEQGRRAYCLFNHLICPLKYAHGNRQIDLLRCFQIDDEFKLRCLLHRQIGRFGIFQDFVYVVGGLAEQVIEVRRVGHEPAFINKLLLEVNSR